MREILPILSKYNIIILKTLKHLNEPDYDMKIVKKINGNYYIQFIKYFAYNSKFYKITSEELTLEQLKSFLFHLYYDEV